MQVGLERRLSSKEHLLLSQKTRVWFPASLQPPVAPAQGIQNPFLASMGIHTHNLLNYMCKTY